MMVHLVAGPSCSGKTTLVEKRSLPGDKVIDFDRIIEELGGSYSYRPVDMVMTARDLWLKRVQARTIGDKWVIWSAPKAQTRAMFRDDHDAQVTVVLTPMAVCLERAELLRPRSWQQFIRRWFEDYEPSRSGQEETLDGSALGDAS